VFGSWVRGEQREGSDLDLLVEFGGPIGWQIVTLEDELSERLEAKVDLVPRRGLRPPIGERILAELVPVWVALPPMPRTMAMPVDRAGTSRVNMRGRVWSRRMASPDNSRGRASRRRNPLGSKA
jgi:uncharacterized protein